MAQNRDLYRKFMHISHYLRHGHGEPELKVAPGQQRVLTALGQSGEMPQRDLIAVLGTSPASISELLTKLEEKRLIKRKRSSADKRVVLVALTKNGKQQADRLLAAEDGLAEDVFGALGEEDREELTRLLDAMVKNCS